MRVGSARAATTGRCLAWQCSARRLAPWLGQLQHAAVGRFSYEPTYVVGNSYANLRIPPDDWKASVRDTFSSADHGLTDYAIPGNFNLYDASYLVNEELWDSYIFTTIPQVADNYRGGREDLALRDRMEKAIERLPVNYQVLINGHYLKGLRYEDLADALDLPMGTVKTHLHRAKRQLRHLLETEFR